MGMTQSYWNAFLDANLLPFDLPRKATQAGTLTVSQRSEKNLNSVVKFGICLREEKIKSCHIACCYASSVERDWRKKFSCSITLKYHRMFVLSWKLCQKATNSARSFFMVVPAFFLALITSHLTWRIIKVDCICLKIFVTQ